MHLSTSSFLSLSTLFAVAIAVPVPAPAPTTGSCEPHRPIKVRPGKSHDYPCPHGWVLSLVEIDICVEIDIEVPHDTLIDVCVTINGDPFGLTGGIKIGHGISPNPKASPPGGAVRIKGTPPACEGKNDPRELLGLCVVVGPNGIKIGAHLGGSDGIPPLADVKAKVGGDKGPLVDTDVKLGGKKDPLADVNAKLGGNGIKIGAQVGGDKKTPPLVDVNAKVGGGKGPLVDTDVNLGGKKNPIADVNAKLGGNGIKIGAQVGGDKKTPPLVDANASVGKDGIKAGVNVAGQPLVDAKVGGPGGTDVNVAGGLLDLKLGGILNLDGGNGNGKKTPKQTVPLLGSLTKTCPEGYLLNLGICVNADVKVGNLAKVDAKVGL